MNNVRRKQDCHSLRIFPPTRIRCVHECFDYVRRSERGGGHAGAIMTRTPPVRAGAARGILIRVGHGAPERCAGAPRDISYREQVG
jgi:hypothetical protein